MSKAKRAGNEGKHRKKRKAKRQEDEWRDRVARWCQSGGEAWLKCKSELPSACFECLQKQPGFAELSEHLETLEAMLGVTATPQRSRAP